MIASSMELIQQFSLPIARSVRPSLRTCLRSCTMALATSSPCDLSAPSTTRDSQSQVLLGLSEKELQQLALDLGQQSYRGKQLHHLIYQRKVREIQDLYQLPRAFRDDLQEAGWRVGRSLIFRNVTAADGTVKLLLKLHDNRLIETVGIPVEGGKGSVRLTACVSSQVLAIEEVFKQRVTNVVFMGMGEPMLNMKRVLEAHHCLNKDVQIGQRLITISTVGVPNTIKKLASHKLQSTLAVSLHAPNQKLRESIVPSAKSYPLDALLRDCKEYFLETSRRISFEYALLAGVNDSVDHAMELAQVLHGWGQGYHVNLIPFNPIEGSEYHRPYKKAVQAFVSTLESLKIAVSVRQTRGLDANAACGQLRNNFQKDPFVTDEDLTLSR
ncbi:uncharacterized protein LOC129294419 isoform X2 [Prosopis cineraria]|uniref:uncharacterized protein LOC129294419 isoform X2 n=1 Tax=Prosopis cineraria TaxID=364024 RepID=UPI0024100401|nr:uncharacterized protein LOC129294419 isoform X2 [Prosopis cineraria]